MVALDDQGGKKPPNRFYNEGMRDVIPSLPILVVCFWSKHKEECVHRKLVREEEKLL